MMDSEVQTEASSKKKVSIATVNVTGSNIILWVETNYILDILDQKKISKEDMETTEWKFN